MQSNYSLDSLAVPSTYNRLTSGHGAILWYHLAHILQNEYTPKLYDILYYHVLPIVLQGIYPICGLVDLES